MALFGFVFFTYELVLSPSFCSIGRATRANVFHLHYTITHCIPDSNFD